MSDKKDDNDFLDNFTDNYISMRENDNDIENDWIYYFSIGYKITRDNNETFSENKKESDENEKENH